MEAGNRCKDECLPEETNRRIVDIISDVNMAYSEHARMASNYEPLDFVEPAHARDSSSELGSPLAYSQPCRGGGNGGTRFTQGQAPALVYTALSGHSSAKREMLET